MREMAPVRPFNRRKVLVLSASWFASGGLLAGCSPRAPIFKSTDITGAAFAQDLKLTDHTGQVRTMADFRGKAVVVFFGFTQCPDVCPTTLARMVRLRNELGQGPGSFDIVYVSVDPERDGPAEVGRYAEMFGAPVIGLTGSPGQISQVKKQFGIFSQKVPDGAGSYTVDHTATVLLFGRDGKFDSTIAHEEQDPAALDKLRLITA